MYQLINLKILDRKLFCNFLLRKLKGQIQEPHYANLIIIECKDLGKKCKPIQCSLLMMCQTQDLFIENR